jgi:hypothetical protein
MAEHSMSKSATGVLIMTVVWSLLVCMGAAVAGTVEGNPGNYRELIPKLKPGDTLKLAAGEYKDQLRFKDLNGEEGKPIVVTGPEGGEPAVFVASAEHNTVQLDGCSHLTLRNAKLDGRNHNGPLAITFKGSAVLHHIAFENLTIVNYGADQSLCAVLIGNCYDVAIRGCTIVAPGTGLYVGDYRGTNPFARLLVENNVFIDPVGYCAQFKPQNSRPENMPEGPTIIRNNVFVKTKNASGGALVSGRDAQRPSLNIAPMPPSGRGSNDMYLVYGNLFYQDYMNDALFQGAGNIALYDNLFVNELGSTDAINFQKHVYGKIRKLWVFNNTVVCRGTGIQIGGTDDKELHVFGNAVFAGKPLALSANVQASDNLTAKYEQAAEYLNAPFAKVGELDLFPKVGKLAAPKAFDVAGAKEFKDWNLDFNGSERAKTFFGAYAGEGTNPGWKLELAVKRPLAAARSEATKGTAGPGK